MAKVGHAIPCFNMFLQSPESLPPRTTQQICQGSVTMALHWKSASSLPVGKALRQRTYSHILLIRHWSIRSNAGFILFVMEKGCMMLFTFPVIRIAKATRNNLKSIMLVSCSDSEHPSQTMTVLARVYVPDMAFTCWFRSRVLSSFSFWSIQIASTHRALLRYFRRRWNNAS